MCFSLLIFTKNYLGLSSPNISEWQWRWAVIVGDEDVDKDDDNPRRM